MKILGHHTQQQSVVWSISVVMMIVLGIVGCSWFEGDRDESPTGPAGRAEQVANFGGAAVAAQWCLTVYSGGFRVNFPQAGNYRLHYGVQQGWNGDIVLGLNRATTFSVGLRSGHVLTDVRVQAVTLKAGATGRNMGAGVMQYYGPGDAGAWSDVALVDSSQAEVALMEDGQLRVIPCPVQCPSCDCPTGGGGASCDLLNDAVAGNFTDNGDGTVSDSRTGLMWLKDAGCLGTGRWDTGAVQQRVTDLNNGAPAAACQDYPNGTYTDWRLPTVQEFVSVLQYSAAGWGMPAGNPFVGVGSFYWTANDAPGDRAWDVSLSVGDVFSVGEAGAYAAWAVR